ncbi:clock-controlled 8 (ccg-8) [Fusarium pseudoanthophilum]|uniref:Clock-controlled 8 (Ccg-8) n=1 Tax=Fusarium pseudoanthophilum TaxID=48495 RepID=A0A8H5KWX7_9HYPO|nr:clock-controlled 8 (ccg-8) [Fusarium pseudoanthophilum]
MERNHMLPDRESESRHVLGPPPARPQSLMAFSPPAYSNVASPNAIKFPDVPSDIPTSLPPLARFDADNDTKLPPLSSLTSEMAMEPTKTWLPFHPIPYPPVHAHSIDSPTRMDLDGSSNSVVSAASPDALLDARAGSVSLDDPDVRLAAEALGDLRAGMLPIVMVIISNVADFISSPPHRNSSLPVSPPTSGLQSNQPQSPQPEPLLSLLTTTHPLLASTIEGATSAYGGAKNFSPRFRSGAEYVEGYLTPIANTVGSVGRVTGVEGGVRWFLGAGRRQNSSTSDLETGNSKKRRKTDEDEAVSNKRFESEGMQQMSDEQMDTAPSPSSKTMSRRMSTTSTVDTLPAYDELRSPAYTETDSNSPRPSRPNSAWQSRLITSTSGLSVAMSQESLRSLKYCLQWLRWANDHIARVISALKTTLDEYEKVPDGQSGEQADPESRSQLAARISNLKGDVLRTLREAINTVSKYAGGALPENARILVRRHLTSLPQRFRVATMTDRNAGQQDNETALTEGAHKVLVLAKEGLDMVVQVSGVVDGTIVSAEQWLDRMGKRRAQEDEKPMLPQTESLLQDPDIQFDTLDLVCPINSDDIKNRWLNSYVPLPGQSPKNYSQSVINFVYRMLKSYASTVVRGRLPPFIHPMQQSLVPLSTCFTLVRICDPLPRNVSIAADILQREMTRLYEERGTYEGIDLLGLFQAYLIYSMVLFFHLGPSMPFLRQAMINLQEIACTTSREGLVCTAEQRGAVPKWESWIMAEAKRRTLYTMYFLDNVLSAHDGITTYLGTELRGLYSPASKYLWQADRNVWEQSYNSHLAEWGSEPFRLDELWPFPDGMSEEDIKRQRRRVDRWLEDVDEFGTMLIHRLPSFCISIYNDFDLFHDMWNATGPDSNRNAPPGVVPDYNNPEDVYWTLNIYEFMSRERLVGTLGWKIITAVMYCVTCFMTTILLLMARVFAVEPRVAKGIKILIWALLVAYIPIQILRIVNCYPIRTYWDPDVRNARCLNQRKIFFSDLSLSIVTDLVILLIPIPLTWKLRMSIGKRIKIVLLLGAGGIATALTLFRVAKAVDFLNSDDITVDYTPIGILTALEITIGFVCACLPSLNLLIEHHVRKRRRARNPNWPRDRTRTSLFKKRFRWISSSTEHMPSRPNRPSDGMIDLDVEMAMLTGQPVRLRTGRTASAGSHDIRPLDHRLNSGDGRREGWLSQDRDEQDEVQDSKFIMRMVEESRARADEGAKESWCPVWDGPRDPMASQGSWKFSVRSH